MSIRPTGSNMWKQDLAGKCVLGSNHIHGYAAGLMSNPRFPNFCKSQLPTCHSSLWNEKRTQKETITTWLLVCFLKVQHRENHGSRSANKSEALGSQATAWLSPSWLYSNLELERKGQPNLRKENEQKQSWSPISRQLLSNLSSFWTTLMHHTYTVINLLWARLGVNRRLRLWLYISLTLYFCRLWHSSSFLWELLCLTESHRIIPFV